MNKLLKNLTDINSLDKVEKTILFRDAITSVHEEMKNMEGSYDMAEADKINPVKHTFGNGFYMRETTVPEGQYVITKIHKKENPLFLLKGKCTIITEEGSIDYESPCYSVTKPGTQRMIKTNSKCTWVTVHVTEANNLEDVEKDVIAKDFNDPLVAIANNNIKNIKE